MNILVIGSGGREHALVYALNRSPSLDTLYALPGNGGINQDATAVDIPVSDHDAIATFCKKHNIGLAVIGPEDPLVAGLTDALEAKDILVFGPGKEAAQLEGSKAFMKQAAKHYGIPTADYASFTDKDEAKAYIEEKDAPIVIKTDGLAAGKGVVICQTKDEALQELDEYFAGKFGDAGKKVVIEEFLSGEEASFFAICDGKKAIAFGSAQDHKTVGEGDTGPNTGGMGTYSPAPVVTDTLHQRIMDELVTPLVEGMAQDGIPYKGVLFVGVMVDGSGNPKLLEYNVRFGDPECQVLMARLESDLVPLLVAAAKGDLGEQNIQLSDHTALCVVMASKGYPGSYEKKTEIQNLDKASSLQDTIIFHAGTTQEDDRLLAIGGRVLGVTALGSDIIEAQQRAYQAVDAIDWNNGFCRRDIGWRAIERIKMAS